MKLIVPSNINIRREIWKGLSYPDAARVAIISAISVVLAIIYVKAVNPSAQFTATITVIIVMGIAFMTFQRLNGISTYQIITTALNYKKEQQNFLFKRGEK